MNQKRRARIQIPKKTKTAFVCSGGAVKAGAFHLGVALALQEKGFRFIGGLRGGVKQDQSLTMQNSSGREIRVYVGSSAGSIISSFLCAGYTLEQVFDSFLKRKISNQNSKQLKPLTYRHIFALRNDMTLLGTLRVLTEGPKISTVSRFIRGLAQDSYDTFFKWSWLKWPGLFSTSGVERYLREEVLPSNQFEDYEAEFYVVGTQLNHSKKVVFGKHALQSHDVDRRALYMEKVSISDACAASIALPFVFVAYTIKNEKGHSIYYFDGEIRDTLSTHVAYDAGADLIIASYTHQPYHFVREIGSLHEYGIPSILIQALYLLIEKKIQSAITTNDRNRAAIEATAQFLKEHQISEKIRTQCVEMLETKLGSKANVDYIYIRPRANDQTMFFGEYFNLSASKMSEMVRSGFRSAIDILRRYEFEK